MEDFLTYVFNTARVYMVDFGRAKTGDPHRRFPDIDDVGYHDDAFPMEHGPITSAMVGQTRVTVRFDRTQISPSATLFVVAADPDIVQITDPFVVLKDDVSQNIEFTAAKAGRTAIQIRYNSNDGPVLGELYVQVYERIVIRMRLHIVTIVQRNDDGNIVYRMDQPASFFGASCPTTAEKLRRVQELVYEADEIWIPHGIAFIIDDVFETEWGSAELGTQSAPTKLDIFRAGAFSPHRSPAHVNVFCVPRLDVAGTGVPPGQAGRFKFLFPIQAGSSGVQRNACGLYLNCSTSAPQEAGATIAHEMAHYMGLCSEKMGHSTGDLASSMHTRDDSVARRRVMYPVEGLMDTQHSMPWRQDTGYGPGAGGGFFTYRRLPAAQDVTFEESQRARNSAMAPGFFG